MNPDKNAIDIKGKKEIDVKKSADVVETPTPPQDMDPSKKPKKENGDQKNVEKTIKTKKRSKQ